MRGLRLRAALQLVSAIVALPFLSYVWPASPSGYSPKLVAVWTPWTIWLPPFLVYLGFALAPAARVFRWKGIAAAFIGSILLVVVFQLGLAVLVELEAAWYADRFARCVESGREMCLGQPIIDPTPPPRHWEWAVGAYGLGLIGLYRAIGMLEARVPRVPE